MRAFGAALIALPLALGLAVLDGRILTLGRRSPPRGLTNDAAKESGRGSNAA